MRAMRWSARAAVVAGLLAAATAVPTTRAAGYARSLEFEAAGVLPSAEPDVIYATDPSVGDPELDAALVAGGVLEFDTIGGCCGFYLVSAPGIDLTEGFTLETRLRVDQMEGPIYGGFALLLLDREIEHNLLFQPDGVAVNAVTAEFPSGTLVEVDHSVFRTYRLTAAPGAGAAELWIDAELRATAQPPAELTDAGTAGWVFGDLAGPASNARVAIDYVRVTVPEPATGGLAGGLTVAVLAARRRAPALAGARAPGA